MPRTGVAGCPASTPSSFIRRSRRTVIARKFRGGELDLARDLLPLELDEILRDSRSRQRLVEAPKKNTYFILFNAVSGPVTRAAGGAARTRRGAEAARSRLAHARPLRRAGGVVDSARHARARRRAPVALHAARCSRSRRCGRQAFEPGTTLAVSIQPLLRDRTASLAGGRLRVVVGSRHRGGVGTARYAGVPRHLEGQCVDRPDDRPLERRLRRSGQFHVLTVSLRQWCAAQLLLLAGSGQADGGGASREPARVT